MAAATIPFRTDNTMEQVSAHNGSPPVYPHCKTLFTCNRENARLDGFIPCRLAWFLLAFRVGCLGCRAVSGGLKTTHAA